MAALAREFGVGWHAAMAAVVDHGTPLVEDPDRLQGVTALGLDETKFLSATPTSRTAYVPALLTWAGPGCSTSCLVAAAGRSRVGSTGKAGNGSTASTWWPLGHPSFGTKISSSRILIGLHMLLPRE